MKTHKLFITGIILCTISLSALIPSVYFWFQNKKQVQAAIQSSNGKEIVTPTTVARPDVITGRPTELHIPSLGLDLGVADGIYNPKTGQWTLSNDKVHYALMTVEPNNVQGNTLIYGHYRPGVFSTLKSIQPGAKVIVRTDSGNIFNYKYSSQRVVDPSDGTVFQYEGKPILTLQTCTGRYMQNRQLFTFNLESVSRAES